MVPLNDWTACWKLLEGDGRANGRRFRLEMLSKTKGAFASVHIFISVNRVLCGSECICDNVEYEDSQDWTANLVMPGRDHRDRSQKLICSSFNRGSGFCECMSSCPATLRRDIPHLL